MRRPHPLALASGGAALACLAAALGNPAVFFPAYLSAWCAVATLPLGCLPVLMIAALIRGPWSDPLLPALRRGVRSIPAIGILALPVLVGMRWIYPWIAGLGEGAPAFRAAWLSPAFFAIRTILYLGGFAALGLLILRVRPERRSAAAAGGLIAYAILATFAGVDWILSRDLRFHSSIFGLLTISQQLLGGVAFALAAGGTGTRPERSGAGGILLAATLFWAYLHAMQFIIVWSANLPNEVGWYLRRGDGVWGFCAILLGCGQFLGMFLLLLVPAIRFSPLALAALGGGTIAMRLVESSWLVLPAGTTGGGWTALCLALSAVAVGAGWTWSLRRLPD